MADGKVICKYCKKYLGYWETPKNPPIKIICYTCSEIKKELRDKYRIY